MRLDMTLPMFVIKRPHRCMRQLTALSTLPQVGKWPELSGDGFAALFEK